MTKKKILFLLVLLILFLAITAATYVYIYDRNNQKNLEAASVNVVKADLDYYYAVNNEYPKKTSDMENVLEGIKAGYYRQSQNSISRLKDFNYEISGDEQTYRFIYTDLDGKTITIERNYQTGFHNYAPDSK